MADHSVVVVLVRPEDVVKHPNADTLSIVRIGGYQAVVRTSEWSDLPKLGAYIPPDSILPDGFIPDLPRRVRAVKLRGTYSEGLLVAAPEGSAPGDDVAQVLGIEHYEPVPEVAGADQAPAPFTVSAYDLDNARKAATRRFISGEPVLITEKIHGQNWRAVFHEGQLHVGSRTTWKKPGSFFHMGLTPALEEVVCTFPGRVFIGEQYGFVGGFPYDSVNRAPKIRIFDVWCRDTGWWSNARVRRELPDEHLVPALGVVPWTNLEDFNAYAEGLTVLGGKHVREGCVLRQEQGDTEYRGSDRPVLKLVGRGYLSRKGD